jgi:hypothetical protein
MFTGRSRPTWIHLEPLSYTAISSLVSKTLHRSKDDAASLSRFIFMASSGNPFSARSMLSTFQRQHHVSQCAPEVSLQELMSGFRSLSAGNIIIGCRCSIFFNQHNLSLLTLRYDMAAIEGSLAVQKMVDDPTDLSFLVSHFREFPEEATRYLTWAAFFGDTQVCYSCPNISADAAL